MKHQMNLGLILCFWNMVIWWNLLPVTMCYPLIGDVDPRNEMLAVNRDVAGIFQGDVFLTNEQKDELANRAKQDIDFHKDIQWAVKKDTQYQWPDNIIPYVISGDFSTVEKDMIYEAMSNIQDATCIRFEEYDSSPDDMSYLKIIDGSGCWSYVGRVYKKPGQIQKLSLKKDSCFHTSIVTHELVHALGLWHEQSRPDRDDYVTIYPENMYEGTDKNFDIKYDTNDFDSPYDPDSIMHYSNTAFSKNGEPTIVWNDDPSRKLGGDVLSSEDIYQINAYYDCPVPVTEPKQTTTLVTEVTTAETTKSPTTSTQKTTEKSTTTEESTIISSRPTNTGESTTASSRPTPVASTNEKTTLETSEKPSTTKVTTTSEAMTNVTDKPVTVTNGTDKLDTVTPTTPMNNNLTITTIKSLETTLATSEKPLSTTISASTSTTATNTTDIITSTTPEKLTKTFPVTFSTTETTIATTTERTTSSSTTTTTTKPKGVCFENCGDTVFWVCNEAHFSPYLCEGRHYQILCPQTCSKCQPENPEKLECANFVDDHHVLCKFFAKSGQCTTTNYHDRIQMKTMCPRTCCMQGDLYEYVW